MTFKQNVDKKNRKERKNRMLKVLSSDMGSVAASFVAVLLCMKFIFDGNIEETRKLYEANSFDCKIFGDLIVG